ncbi:MAG: right-handed parallel beta-helix repeat-containing protein [Candidatus Bathyarchaeota archaeon]|nr:right-handed parallel beta-helix repeat-containing protein [Candidatus Bathyarchaeum sp.]
MKTKSLFVVLLIFLLIVVCSPAVEVTKAELDTLVVPDDYGSIQEAINNAVDGDTVYVKKGTYHENIVVNKSLSLIGENLDTTIIDGAAAPIVYGDPSEEYRRPITIQCDNVSISGFKLLYGYAGITIGEVNFCRIYGNRIADNQHGIILVGTSYSNITGNYFESIGLSSAIQLSKSNDNFVSGNYIDSCTEGIQIWSSSYNNTVSENTITNCDDPAIRLQYSSNNTVTRNNISNSGVGTCIYVSNNNTITNNNYVNNTVQFSATETYALTFGYNVSVNLINQNYWNDYNGTDINNDGTGDTPYVIDENNQDSNPIMVPIDIKIIPEFPSWTFLVAGIFAVTALETLCRRGFTQRR